MDSPTKDGGFRGEHSYLDNSEMEWNHAEMIKWVDVQWFSEIKRKIVRPLCGDHLPIVAWSNPLERGKISTKGSEVSELQMIWINIYIYAYAYIYIYN